MLIQLWISITLENNGAKTNENVIYNLKNNQ